MGKIKTWAGSLLALFLPTTGCGYKAIPFTDYRITFPSEVGSADLVRKLGGLLGSIDIGACKAGEPFSVRETMQFRWRCKGNGIGHMGYILHMTWIESLPDSTQPHEVNLRFYNSTSEPFLEREWEIDRALRQDILPLAFPDAISIEPSQGLVEFTADASLQTLVDDYGIELDEKNLRRIKW